jgi:hypothetical protein
MPAVTKHLHVDHVETADRRYAVTSALVVEYYKLVHTATISQLRD